MSLVSKLTKHKIFFFFFEKEDCEYQQSIIFKWQRNLYIYIYEYEYEYKSILYDI